MRTLSLGLVLAVACPAQDGGATRPSFVFLLADDLGWRDLGCYGSTFYETPNIDAIAARGMRFTSAYAACPVCSPTRASILTGKYPARMNTTDFFGGRRAGKLLPASYIDRLPLEETTLAEALSAAGYATGFFGKWHLGRAGFHPEDQGFDVNVGGFWRGHPPAGYFSPYENPRLEDGPVGEHLTDRLTEEAVDFIGSVAGEPFLLYMSYYSVHTPLQAKDDLVARFRAKRGQLPAHEGPRFIPEGGRRARQVQDHAVYAAMLRTLDDSVGRILAALEARGLTGSTVVVFMSDNGGLSTSEGHPTSNLPLRAGKGWLYEGGIREPMIVAWPGTAEPGSVCEVPVISTDFYPTLLEIAGLPARPEQHADGLSLVPLLRGETEALPARPLFWHYPHYGNQGGFPGGAVRAGDLKLIENFETGECELYDLSADLGERADLSAERPDETAALKRTLRAWRERVDARMPTPNPDFKK